MPGHTRLMQAGETRRLPQRQRPCCPRADSLTWSQERHVMLLLSSSSDRRLTSASQRSPVSSGVGGSDAARRAAARSSRSTSGNVNAISRMSLEARLIFGFPCICRPTQPRFYPNSPAAVTAVTWRQLPGSSRQDAACEAARGRYSRSRDAGFSHLAAPILHRLLSACVCHGCRAPEGP